MFCRNCGKDIVATAEYCPNCGARPQSGRSYCPTCGAPSTELSEICTKCGTRLAPAPPRAAVATPVAPAAMSAAAAPLAAGAISPRSRLVTVLLAYFLGVFGAHRFYLGKTGMAVLGLVLAVGGYVLMISGMISARGGGAPPALFWAGYTMVAASGIWAFVEFIIGCIGRLKDKNGLPIKRW